MRRPTSTLFSIHAAVTIVAAAALVFLNVVTDTGQYWAIWPIWALMMLLGAHAGIASLPRHRLLGLWIGGGAMLILGLIGIDLANDGTPWWFWPTGVWLVLTALFVGLSVDLLASIPTQAPPPDEDDQPINGSSLPS